MRLSTRRSRLRSLALLAMLGAFAMSAPGPAASDDADPARPLLGLTFDHYYDAAALKAAVEKIHAAFPGWTRLESMGRSREGRSLWVISVFDPAGRPVEDRPAMYIDGNTHGNEIQGAETGLFTAKYLLVHRSEPWISALLRRAVIHIAPCVNPDSRERFLHEPNDEHSPRRVQRPWDDDHDGLVDEDGPNDLDGDGEILEMRIKDPEGEWVVDERDDRLLRPRKPGEKGQNRLLGREGIDDDGDGQVNEDPPGGVDPNRNWPYEWRPEAGQGGSGPYPLSEPETRATALWVLAHPRIAAVQSYHNAGSMILRPPAALTDAEAEMPSDDKALYDELARRGGILLPGYRYLQIREGLYKVHGGFVDWTYGALGIFSFTNEVWGLFGWGTSPTDPSALPALQWNDVALHGEGFVRWHPVKHPTLGEVELGGWRRHTIRSTPLDFLPELCLRNAMFTLEHAAGMPDVAVTEAEAKEGGARIRVKVENRALLPTIATWAERHGCLPADELVVEGTRILAAVEIFRERDPVAIPIKSGRARLASGIRGTSSRTFDLFVDPSAGTATRVTLSSRLGGVVSAPVR